MDPRRRQLDEYFKKYRKQIPPGSRVSVLYKLPSDSIAKNSPRTWHEARIPRDAAGRFADLRYAINYAERMCAVKVILGVWMNRHGHIVRMLPPIPLTHDE